LISLLLEFYPAVFLIRPERHDPGLHPDADFKVVTNFTYLGYELAASPACAQNRCCMVNTECILPIIRH
jgi:hypothetical protein